MSTICLPNCMLREAKGRKFRDGQSHVPIFCANCGDDGGWVPEIETQSNGFAFYLCNPCAAKWSPLAGVMMVPDEQFWKHINDAQQEEYGRILSPAELVEMLKDGGSMISKLANDRHLFKGGGR